jgi:hypothetical protein
MCAADLLNCPAREATRCVGPAGMRVPRAIAVTAQVRRCVGEKPGSGGARESAARSRGSRIAGVATW